MRRWIDAPRARRRLSCVRRTTGKGTELPRILLVEDHAAFREALAFMLGRRPGMKVVAQAGSVAECRALGGLLGSVDVALLDLALPDGDGTEIIPVLRAANPSARVLVLSASIEAGTEGRVAGAGADGVLNKMAPLAEIAAEAGRLAGEGG
jgi:DNA-binding NarL/FixJ family response regulator